MKSKALILIWLLFLLLASGESILFAQTQPVDTSTVRFEVRPTLLRTAEDLNILSPIDLSTPSNITTEVVYDAQHNRYVFQNKIGDTVVGMPFFMTPAEYMAFRAKQGYQHHFKQRNAYRTQHHERPTLKQLRKSSGILEDIFGPGGIQITTRGFVELQTGIKHTNTQNPTLPQRARRRTLLDVDPNIDINVNAKVGNKIDFDINYNSDATFDVDARRIKLAYRGEEDDIIKNIEAGNVSMNTTNSLINGGTALFGIKTDLQFGKLRINTLLSQQESESETIQTKGSIQTQPFEMRADEYDANRHFFLGYFFREQYDKALKQLPYVQSEIVITRLEVWVTNKRGDFSQARNIVAFADLGEHTHIHNPMWQPQGATNMPQNASNNLYETLISQYGNARQIHQTTSVLPSSVVGGLDYEKVENARLLSPQDYRFQPQLGYLSLNSPLQPDEVLAVAFEYTYQGKAYQVGEFSNNVLPTATSADNKGDALFVKLLKPVSMSPLAHTWHLMMKNIYAIGMNAYNISSTGFKLNISYQSDSTSIYTNTLPEGNRQGELLLRVMNLDNLNSKNDPYPDGIVDFLDGYTIDAQHGLLIFPVIEPFGSHLEEAIGNEELAQKYIFRELYDSTLTVAKQIAEKNKYIMSGEYQGASTQALQLNTFNVARGSVKVMAGGKRLTEGIDYSVDYLSGNVTILNQGILSSNTPISITMENQAAVSMQRKTIMGVNLTYDISKNLQLGTTLMHYYEKPLTTKIAFGDESVKNTLWGANVKYQTESMWLTNVIDRLPFVEAAMPSSLEMNAEFAQLRPGHYQNKYIGDYSYLDDFETSTASIDLRSPYAWSLSATPFNTTSSGLFPEAQLINHIDYGKNRALLAWFFIDNMFTQRNNMRTPAHIKNDVEQLSNHFVREIYEREIYPNRDAMYGQPITLPILNLSYYPDERGPYNLDTNINNEGKLLNPKQRWGGITRRMDTRDFEAANIEYIEFWLMDPFVNDTLKQATGGDLYINLGEISEDILRDGQKFIENGLPLTDDPSAVDFTVWGKIPKRQSTVYAFDVGDGVDARLKQDVGLNGLSSEEEKTFPTYQSYVNTLSQKLSSETLTAWQTDNHSPLNDPAGDNFRHYRGSEQDALHLSVLERYKYYNGTEGNSASASDENGFSTAAKASPDVEDIDVDNTLNENESYYQYKIALRPEQMRVGHNYIVDKRDVSVTLRNGESSEVTWYQFKVPIKKYTQRIGNIQGFNNIRFMRLFLTDFDKPTFLRFATLQLVRSEWRTYNSDLQHGGVITSTGRLELSSVNIEENGDKTPVNYVLPPGVSRLIDPSEPQLRQQNEQALALKAIELAPGDVRAVYKNVMYDLRRFKRLQLFVHAEAIKQQSTTLKHDDMSIFIRLGSDFRNNYYEYELPLKVTPEGRYNSNILADQEAVWMPDNMIDITLSDFTNLKLQRNTAKRQGDIPSYLIPYTVFDAQQPNNSMTIVGNPSLGEIKVMMIGVRNRTNSNSSAEVWINELRLKEFDENGGWAAQGNINMGLSDIASINLSGRKETAGFGALNQSLLQRRQDDYSSYNLSVQADLGRLLPAKAKVSAPLYVNYGNDQSTPEYDPFNSDIKLQQTLESLPTQTERDSVVNLTSTLNKTKSISLSNVKVDIKSKTPMPYDPANFTMGYTYNETKHQAPEVAYATTTDSRLHGVYTYSPNIPLWEPFRFIDSQSGWLKLIKSLNYQLLPNNVQITSSINRHYQETQLRDVNAIVAGNTALQRNMLTFSQNFVWDRTMSVSWDITRQLKTTFRSGTLAEIEEPYLQVNRDINRGDYEIWRDSVVTSLRQLGKPQNYEQVATATYSLPLAMIPPLDWISMNVSYNGRYRWQRGAQLRNVEIGNMIQNELGTNANGRFNMIQLYNKLPYLRQINNSFGGLSAERQKLSLSITDYLLRGIMMVRSVSANFSYRQRSDFSGFMPMIGDMFGQQRTNGMLIPGMGYAFGIERGEEFLERALQHGWLTNQSANITPALFNTTTTLQLNALIEPINGLSINLTGLYENNQRKEVQYMFEGMPTKTGGSFAISTIGLRGLFSSGSASNDYQSSVFEHFLDNRTTWQQHIQTLYASTTPPSTAIPIQENNSEVLIPSFLEAYTRSKVSKNTLSPFPSILGILPNWDVTYNVLTGIPTLQNIFQSFNISHKYIGQYRIGSFGSHLSFESLNGNSQLGYIIHSDGVTQVASWEYDIPNVNLIESFNPLIEVRGTLLNNATLSGRWNKTKSMNLNLTSRQVVETNDNDFVVGFGYRFANFDRVIGIGSNSMKSKARNRVKRHKTNEEASQQASSFQNDLNIRIDISNKITQALLRKIDTGFSQATAGMHTSSIKLSADYALSQSLTLRAFFDRISQRPLISSVAYPTVSTNIGVSLRMTLDE